MRLRGGLALVCAGLLAAGCGGGQRGSAGAGVLSGSVVVDGAPEASSISEYAAEEFVRFHPEVRVRVDRSGEAVALERLCRREVDVVHATRPPASCPGGRPTLRAAEVAVDALAVIAHRAGRARCLRVAEVRRLLAAARGGGGAAAPVRVVGAERAATYPALAPGGGGERVFPPDDAAIAAAVARDPRALGFVGAGWLATAGAVGVRAVAIAEPGGCVRPVAAAIRAGRYRALTRPVLFVFRADVARDARAHSLLRFAVEFSAAVADAALLLPAGVDELRRAEQAVG